MTECTVQTTLFRIIWDVFRVFLQILAYFLVTLFYFPDPELNLLLKTAFSRGLRIQETKPQEIPAKPIFKAQYKMSRVRFDPPKSNYEPTTLTPRPLLQLSSG